MKKLVVSSVAAFVVMFSLGGLFNTFLVRDFIDTGWSLLEQGLGDLVVAFIYKKL